MTNTTVMALFMQAYDYGHDFQKNSERLNVLATLPFARRIGVWLQAVVDRAEFLLMQPNCIRDLAHSLTVHARFSAMAARFLACWVILDYSNMMKAARALEAQANAVQGDDRDFYITEAYHATVPASLFCSDATGLRNAHAGLAHHEHFFQLMRGAAPAGRHGHPFGHTAISCLAAYHAEYEWLAGHLDAALHMLALSPGGLEMGHHAHSLVFGTMKLLQPLTAYGYHHVCIRVMEWAVQQLPKKEGTAGHIFALGRKVARFALRSWAFAPRHGHDDDWNAAVGRGDGEGSEQEHVELQAVVQEMLALIDEFMRVPPALAAPGVCAPLVLAFPRLLELPLRFSFPLECHVRMMQLASDRSTALGTNAILFDVLHWRTERLIRQAGIIISTLQHSHDEKQLMYEDERVERQAEAERILNEARRLAGSDGIMIELKVLLQWGPLWQMQRQGERGKRELLAVLTRMDESSSGVDSPHVELARPWVKQLR